LFSLTPGGVDIGRLARTEWHNDRDYSGRVVCGPFWRGFIRSRPDSRADECTAQKMHSWLIASADRPYSTFPIF
jgi:hypothetical protein